MRFARRGTNAAIYAMAIGAGLIAFSLIGVFGYPHVASRYYFGLLTGCICMGAGLVTVIGLGIMRRRMSAKAKSARVLDRWSEVGRV